MATLTTYQAGDIIYDEGENGDDCWVLESGVCVSSQLIPGITIPGTWEWKETRPYSPGKFGSFFGARSAATTRHPGCNLTPPRLQPHATQAATSRV